MSVIDNDGPEASTATTPLELLHRHVMTNGEVDIEALLASGVDLRQLRPALEQLRRARRLLLEFEADRISQITLLGQAYRKRRVSTPASDV